MTIKVGCDLVEIKKFKKSMERGGSKFLDKIFLPQELAVSEKIETLAGIFAAKEAVFKALGGKVGDWHNLEIVKNKNGRPEIKMLESNDRIISQDISISHDGEYAMAVAVFLIL